LENTARTSERCSPLLQRIRRRVALSAPAAAERVRKLENRGVITGYSAQVNPAQVGLPLLVFIQLRCSPGKCLLKTGSADTFPEVLEMHKLSGSHCSLLKVAVSSMQHLEAFNERLGAHGQLIVNIVTSSALTKRLIGNTRMSISSPRLMLVG
jgi:Lrp/AsnC family transcriptional regulator, leucine-responsive regulatory protein